MTDLSGYIVVVGALAIILIVCARLLQHWKGWAIRTRPITVRPVAFAGVGVVLLFIGVGGLTAIAAGALPSSPELSAIIIAILGVAIVCFVFSAILLLLYVPLPRRRPQKRVEESGSERSGDG
jgi:uncharacterized BrkB/YihY/UPF0761 family membrane protein